ncbi:uncharacterized protein LOC135959771, partial [Calliphora vicina]|uniref:uncharacterized protein LOC135959771 n=1 Tax=Calliphora vicina TaxID=7373 RepID=UPI00325A654F
MTICPTCIVYIFLASDDNSDSDGCTGFSAVEIIEPTPSVVEILAAMALGPMLAVPSVDQPATLTVSDFNVFTDLKELALAEIKARSLELTPRNLDVIPEETGDTTIPIETISTSANETNEPLTINLTIAPALEFNTVGSNKEILDINSSEISSSSTESVICSTDEPIIEATDVSARNKTSDDITLTKDQELKETSANENISYSSTFKSTKSISEKSHLDIDSNTAAANMDEPMKKGSISDDHYVETLSAATELQSTSELINNKGSLVLEESLLADKTNALHELHSEIKLQDIPDSINNETLSSHLKSNDQANFEMHSNNESSNQCHVGENNLVKYSTQHSEIIVGQNSSEITLQDTSDTTYNKTACSIQSNTKEPLSAACSKEPEKNTSNDDDSENPLELNDIEMKGHNTIPKEQYSETKTEQNETVSKEQTSETTCSDSNVESKTEDNISDGNSRVLEDTNSKEQTLKTQTQENEIEIANSDATNSDALSASSNLNMPRNIEDNMSIKNSRALDDTSSEMQTLETMKEQNEMVTQMVQHCTKNETQMDQNEIVSEEQTSVLSAPSGPNVESNSDLNSEQQTTQNDNVEEQSSNIQQFDLSDCTNIEVLTASSESNMISKPALNENSRLLDETISNDQSSEIHMVQNKAVLLEQSFDIPLKGISDSTKSEPLSASLDPEDYISNKNSRVLGEIESKEQSSEPRTEQNEIVMKQEVSEIKLETRMQQNEIVSEADVESKNDDNISIDSPERTKIISKEQSSAIQAEQNEISSEEQSPTASSSSESKTTNNTSDENFRVLEETIEIISKEQSAELPLEGTSDCMDAGSESKIHSDKDQQGLNKEQSSKIPTKSNEIISEEQTSTLSASSESNTEFKSVDETIYLEQSNETQVKQNEIVSEEPTLSASSDANVESTTEKISSIENTIVIDDITYNFQNEIVPDEQPTALPSSSKSTVESKTEENTTDEKSSVLDETIPNEQVEQNDIVSEEPTPTLRDSSETNVETKNYDNTSDEKSSVLDGIISKEQFIETPVEQKEIVSEELKSSLSASSAEQSSTLSNCSESNMESKTSEETIPKEQSNEIQVKQNDIDSEEPTPAVSASSETNVEAQYEPNEIVSEELTSALSASSEEQPADSSETIMESKTGGNTSDEKSSVLDQTIPKEQSIETHTEQNETVSEELTSALSAISEEQQTASSESNMESDAGANTSDEKSSVLDETIPIEQSIETPVEQNEKVSEEPKSVLSPSSKEQPSTLSNCSESNMQSKTSDEKSSVLPETIPQEQSNETQVEQNDIASEESTPALPASSETDVEQNEIVSKELTSALYASSEEQSAASSESNMEYKTGANTSTLSNSFESNIESKTSDEKLNVLNEAIPKEQSFETQVEQNEIVSEELTFTLSAISEEQPSASSESNMESKAGENTSDEKSSVLDETIPEDTITEDPKISLSASSDVPPSNLSNCSESNMESQISDEKSNVIVETIPKQQSIETQMEQNEIVSEELTSALSSSSEEQPASSSESNMESKTDANTSDEKPRFPDETIPKEQSIETQTEKNGIVSENLTSALSASVKEPQSTLSNCSESNIESQTSDEKSSVLPETIPKEQSFETQMEQNEIVSEEVTPALSTSMEEQPAASSESNMESKAGENTSDEKSSVLDETIPAEQEERSEIVTQDPTKSLSASSDVPPSAMSASVKDPQSTLSNCSDSNIESQKSDEKSSVLPETIPKEQSFETQMEQNEIVSEEVTPALSISTEEQPAASSESNMESKAGENTSDEKSSVLDETIPAEQEERSEIVTEDPTISLSASSDVLQSNLPNCSESNMESQTLDEKSNVLVETIPKQQSIETQMEQNEIVSEELTSALSLSSEEPQSTLSNCSESNIESQTSDEKSSVLPETISEEQSFETQVEPNEIVSEEVTSALSTSTEEKPSALSNSSESNMESKTSDEKSSVLPETIPKVQSIETLVKESEIISEEVTSDLSASAEEQPSALSNSSESNMESKTSNEKSSVLPETIPKEQSIETQVEQNKIVSEEPISASSETNVESKSKEVSSIEHTIVIDDMTSKIRNEIVSEKQPPALPSSSESNMESKCSDTTSDEKSNVRDEAIPQEQSIETQVEQNKVVSEELTSFLSASSEEQPAASSESNMESKAGEYTSDEKSRVLDETIPAEQDERSEMVTEDPTISLSSSSDVLPSNLRNCSESNMESQASDEKSSVLAETIPQQQSIETLVGQNEIVSKELTSGLVTSSEEQPSTLSNYSDSNMEPRTVENTSAEKSSILNDTISEEQSIETQVEQNEIASKEIASALSASAEEEEELSAEKSSILDETISQEQSIETLVDQNKIVLEEVTSALSVSAEEKPSALSNSSETNIESKPSDEKSSVLPETIPKEQSIETPVEENAIASNEMTSALSASVEEKLSALSNSSGSNMESKTSNEKSSVLPETIPQEQSIETQVDQNKIVSEEPISASSETKVESKTKEISSIENTIVIDDMTSKLQNEIVLDEQPSDLSSTSESNMESKSGENTLGEKSSVLAETITQEQSIETLAEQNETVSEEVKSALYASSEEQSSTLSHCSESNMESQKPDEISSVLAETITQVQSIETLVEQNETVSAELKSALSASSEVHPSTLAHCSESNIESQRSDEKSNVLAETIPQEQSNETQQDQIKIVLEEVTTALPASAEEKPSALSNSSESNMESKTSDEKPSVLPETIPKEQSLETPAKENEIASKEITSALSNSSESNMEYKTSSEKSSVLPKTISQELSIETQVDQNKLVFEEPISAASETNVESKTIEISSIENTIVIDDMTSKIQNEIVSEEHQHALSKSSESNMDSKSGENTSDEKSSVLTETQEQSIETLAEQNEIVSEEVTSALSASSEEQPSTLFHCSESNMESQTSDEKSSVIPETISQELSIETQMEQNKIVSEEPISASSETNVESKTIEISSIENKIVIDDMTSKIQNEIISEEKSSALSSSSESNIEPKSVGNTLDEKSSVLPETIPQEQSIETQVDQNKTVLEEPISASSETNVESKTIEISSIEKTIVIDDMTSKIQNEIISEEKSSALSSSSESNIEPKSVENTLDEKSSVLPETIPQEQSIETQVDQNKIVLDEVTSTLSASTEEKPSVFPNSSESNIESKTDEKSSVLTETIPKEQSIETPVEENEIVLEELTSALSDSLETNVESKTKEISSIENTIVIDSITSKIQNEIILEEQPSALSSCSESNIESKTGDTTSDEKSNVLNEAVPQEQSVEIQMEQNEAVSEEVTSDFSASAEEQPSALSNSSESNMISKTSNEKSSVLPETIPQEQSIETLVDQNKTVLEEPISASSETNMESKTKEISSIEHIIVIEDMTSKIRNEIVSEEQPSALPSSSESNTESKCGDTTSDEKSNVPDDAIPQEQSIETQVEQNKLVLEELTSFLSTSSEEQPAASSESNMESKAGENTTYEKSSVLDETILAKHEERSDIVIEDPAISLSSSSDVVAHPNCSESNMESQTSDEKSSVLAETIPQQPSIETLVEQNEIVSKELTSGLAASSDEQPSTLSNYSESNIESKISDEKSGVFDEVISKSFEPQVEQNEIASSKIESEISEKSAVGDKTIPPEQSIETHVDQIEIVSEKLTLALSTSLEDQPSALSNSSESNMESKTGVNTSDEKLGVLTDTISQEEQNIIVSEEPTSPSSETNEESKSNEISSIENTIVIDDITSKIQNEIISEEQPSALFMSSESTMESKTEENTSDEKSSVLGETIPKEQLVLNDTVSEEVTSALSASSKTNVESITEEISSIENTIVIDDITSKIQNEIVSNEQPSDSNKESKTGDTTSDKKSIVLDDTISQDQSIETQVENNEIVSALSASSEEQPSALPTSNIEAISKEQCNKIEVQQNEIVSEQETLSLPASSEANVESNTENILSIENTMAFDETSKNQNKIVSESNIESKPGDNTDEKSNVIDETIPNEQSNETPVEQNKIVSEEQPSSEVQSRTAEKTSNECSKGLKETNSNEQSSEKQQDQSPEMPMHVISDSTDNESSSMNSESNVKLKPKDNTLHEDSGEPQQKEVILDSTDYSDGSKSCEQHEIEENLSNEHSEIYDEIICKEQPSEILQEQNKIIPKEQTSEMSLKDISNPTIKQQSEIQSSVIQLQDTVDPTMNEALSGIPESYVQNNTDENSSHECSKVLDEIISKEQCSEAQQEQMPLKDISNSTSNEQNEIVSKEQASDIQPQITLDPMNNEPLTDSSESNNEHLNLLNKTVSKEQSPETVLEQNEIISKEKLSEISVECNSNFIHNETLSENLESNAQSTILENTINGQKDISNPTINGQNELVSNTQSSETLPVQNEIISKEQSSEILLECNSNTTNNETLSKNSKALDEIVPKEQISEIQPKQNKIVLSEKSSEIALENSDSTRNELLKELISGEKSSESQTEQKDIVVKEQSSDIQLQIISETNVQSKVEGNSLDECSKESNEIILEIQHSEIKLEQSAEAQLKFISEHKNNDDLPECLASNVQIKTEQNNSTEYSEELNEQISKEHLSILDKHEIADSSKHEASSIQSKPADITTADISGELNEIDMPTTNTSPLMPSTIIETNLHTPPVPIIVSESESDPKLSSASGNDIQIQDTLNILEDQISLDDSPTMSRQSTVVEIEEDNNNAAVNQQPQGKHNISKKLQRQYRVVDTTPSFEDVSPQPMPQTTPPSTANTLAGLCQKFIHDKHLLTALENRRRRTLLMHRFLSTLDLSHSTDDSMEETNRVHTEVLITENPVVCESSTSSHHDHDSDHDDCSDSFTLQINNLDKISYNFINNILFSDQLSYDSKPYADSRSNTIEEYIDNENDEKDILAINYKNNSTTNTITTPTITTTTTNSS